MLRSVDLEHIHASDLVFPPSNRRTPPTCDGFPTKNIQKMSTALIPLSLQKGPDLATALRQVGMSTELCKLIPKKVFAISLRPRPSIHYGFVDRIEPYKLQMFDIWSPGCCWSLCHILEVSILLCPSSGPRGFGETGVSLARLLRCCRVIRTLTRCGYSVKKSWVSLMGLDGLRLGSKKLLMA